MLSTLFQVLILLSFLNPCVHAYHICTDVHSRVEGAPLDRKAELTTLQVMAMVFQSIPTSLMYAQLFLKGPEHELGPFLCVLLSCLATGFASASISFDIDTNPDYVNADPRFYGYILPTRRTSTFLLLLMFQTAHVLIKISGMACLLVLTPAGFHSYLWVRLRLAVGIRTMLALAALLCRATCCCSWSTRP